jgi:hypothetical protein
MGAVNDPSKGTVSTRFAGPLGVAGRLLLPQPLLPPNRAAIPAADALYKRLRRVIIMVCPLPRRNPAQS